MVITSPRPGKASFRLLALIVIVPQTTHRFFFPISPDFMNIEEAEREGVGWGEQRREEDSL